MYAPIRLNVAFVYILHTCVAGESLGNFAGTTMSAYGKIATPSASDTLQAPRLYALAKKTFGSASVGRYTHLLCVHVKLADIPQALHETIHRAVDE